jgi:hypothetical protein
MQGFYASQRARVLIGCRSTLSTSISKLTDARNAIRARMQMIGVQKVECRSPKEQLDADKLAVVIPRGPPPLGKLQRTRHCQIRLTAVQPIDSYCLLCRPRRCPVSTPSSRELPLTYHVLQLFDLQFEELSNHILIAQSGTTRPQATCLTSSLSSRRPTAASISSPEVSSSTTSL